MQSPTLPLLCNETNMPELHRRDLREGNPGRGPTTTQPATAMIVSLATITYVTLGKDQAGRGFPEAMSRASLGLSAMPPA